MWDAEKTLIRLIQRESYDELNRKRLSSLCLFEDEEGILRVQTKISNRPDTKDFCFPMLLPSTHPTVEKLIREKHEESHAGVLTLMNILREYYWITGGRRAVKRVISRCIKCRVHAAKTFTEVTPPLPLDRVRDACVFEIVGVDMAGPLYLRNSKKVYVCIFTCAVYRAVHCELVSSLSSDKFVEALRRFIARRGRPQTIYSDNGTNFVGAENALCALDWNRIHRYCSARKIVWKFNPPTASWWGGFWERLIGVLKSLLKRVLGRAALNYEELCTVLCDCESVINSRPLTYMSENANELRPLSPNMFLQEQRECGVPDLDLLDGESLNKRLVYLAKLREDLRKRFRSEYLGQLVLKPSKASRELLKVGDVVLISNDNSKRLEWPMARVVEMIPGRDGRVRVVKLQTAEGQLTRPIQRICLLESARDDFQTPSEVMPKGAIACDEDEDIVRHGVRRREIRLPIKLNDYVVN